MADAAAEPARRLSGRRERAAMLGLGAALVALAAWAAYLVDVTHAADTRRGDIDAVQGVASRVVTNFYSISYQTFDTDTQRVYADLAEKFKEQAVQQLGATWKQTVVANQLVSHAAVATSGVVNLGARSAEVMVTVRRTSQSAQVKSPVASWASATVQLIKAGGRWLVSGMAGLQ